MTTQEIINLNITIKAYEPLAAGLAQLEADNASLVFDYNDFDGAEAAKAHIRKLKKTKSALEKIRKQEKADSLAYGRKVDDEAKAIAARVDSMVEVHDKPLQEIEARKQARISELQRRVAEIRAIPEHLPETPNELIQVLKRANELVIDDSFGEFKAGAALAKLEVVEEIETKLRAAEDREEVERVARVAAAKVQADREKRLMEEAAANAERAEKERAAKAAQEKERLHKAELENAEQKRLAAEREVSEAVERAKREQANALAEQEREKQKAAKAEEKRQANKAHRAKIQREAIDALNLIIPGAADEIFAAIDAGEIPHITINY